MSIRVIVAAHKAYRMPEDPMYLPIHVGKAGKDLDLGYQGDDAGEDNISRKNSTFCELTGLYWAWKNLRDDYIGLAHYRRHFRGGSRGDKWDRILTEREAAELLKTVDVLLPKKRRYWIETCYNQYVHAHPAEGLDLALEIISAQGEAYARAVGSFRRRRWTHLFNMFIMKRERFDAYCAWLFPILFEMEEKLDLTGWSQNDRRVFGFAAERLLDIWLEANGIAYGEVPVMFMEKQNWIKKGGAFLARKILPSKGR